MSTQNITVMISCDVDVPEHWSQEDIEKYVRITTENLNMWGKGEYKARCWNAATCSVRRSEVFDVKLSN